MTSSCSPKNRPPRSADRSSAAAPRSLPFSRRRRRTYGGRSCRARRSRAARSDDRNADRRFISVCGEHLCEGRRRWLYRHGKNRAAGVRLLLRSRGTRDTRSDDATARQSLYRGKSPQIRGVVRAGSRRLHARISVWRHVGIQAPIQSDAARRRHRDGFRRSPILDLYERRCLCCRDAPNASDVTRAGRTRRSHRAFGHTRRSALRGAATSRRCVARATGPTARPSRGADDGRRRRHRPARRNDASSWFDRSADRCGRHRRPKSSTRATCNRGCRTHRVSASRARFR